MSELICPGCGKENPDGALICQFCDSPLVTFQPRDPNDSSPLSAEPIILSDIHQEIPDWLASIREKKQDDEPSKLDPEFVDNSEEEKPDLDLWLAQLRGDGSEGEKSAEEPPGDAKPFDEDSYEEHGDTTPTWLASIRSKIHGEDPVIEDSEPSEHSGDWLSNLRKQTEELSLPAGEETETLPTTEIDESLALEARLNDSSAQEAETEVPSPDQNVVSDLMAVMQDENQTSLDGEEEDIFIEETDIPNGFGLAENGTLPPASAIFDDNDQPKEKISTKDLPNWLSTFMGVDEGEVPPESALVSGVEDQPRETGLEPGAIPSWVKAMRPVDSIKPDPAKQQEADRRFEEEGPLAGIRGIIPGSEVEFNYARPASKDNRETSLTNISIFENTLQAETEEVKTQVFKRSKTSNVVRWIIAGVLFIVVVMIQIGANPPDLMPKNLPLETMSLFRSVSALNQGATILLVMDYSPGYAAEIETAASAPLSLMMAKQSNLYTLSTSASNLFLADDLIKSVSKAHPSNSDAYLNKEKYQVLGFLPGGQSGMQGLLSDFKGSLPVGLNLKRTAEMDGLTRVNTLDDFDAIFILTDNPDTARTWVEQIKPRLTKPAIWMAISSQAVPMVRPYIRSGQVDGLISGVYGAASFEQIIQQPGTAARIWNGYYIALILAMVMIIAGGFINYIGFSILRAKKKRERQA